MLADLASHLAAIPFDFGAIIESARLQRKDHAIVGGSLEWKRDRITVQRDKAELGIVGRIAD